MAALQRALHLSKGASVARCARRSYVPLPVNSALGRHERRVDPQVVLRSARALCESRHTEPDTGTGSVAMTTLLAAEPQLYVRDIAASCEFYSRVLGFSVAFTYGEPPFYGQVFRDGARLNLRHVDSPVVDPVRRDTEQLLAASITLEDARPLFVEYQNAGVEFAQPLRTEPWGARTFLVRDPDGNLLLFSGRGA